MTYEKRWDEKSSAGIRWEELRWDEWCSVKCGARRVQCEVWTVKCEVWTVKCDAWSAKSAVWSVDCEVRSVKCEVWSAKSAVWSVKSVEREVRRVQCEECRVVDQNSFIPERPFFANKNFTFAKLSRTPCLSFAGPMLANNTSYEDSFTTCQITPENHGSLLGSLLNMQLASRNPFSGQIFFAKFTGPPPSTCTLTFARSFA